MTFHNTRRDGLLCALIVVFSVVLIWPVAEMGFQDDWSYIRSALDFARTGHFVYNGWTTAMLGWMIPWGALPVKLFGFSFTAVRSAMLPLDAAMAYLLHACMIRCGVNRQNAIFGTLVICLSPVTTPVTASFMSDVPGMVVVLLCTYLCLRAAAARSDRATIAFLALAAISNVLGGTVRQIAWLGVLVMVPSTAWLLRQRRYVLPVGVALWTTGLASVFGFLHWWNLQPYSVPEHLNRGHVSAGMAHHFGGKLAKGSLCFLLLLFPVLAAWLAQIRRLRRAAVARIVSLTTLGAILLAIMDTGARNEWAAPWIGHLLDSVIYGRGEFPGPGPVTMNLTARAIISLVVLATALVCAELLHAERVLYVEQPSTPGALNVHEMKWIFGPFCATYLLFLLPRTLYEFLYDRYLFGLMPFAIIVLLLWLQRSTSRLPAVAYVALGVFTFVAITGTHDWYAVNRARVRAANELQSQGFPRTVILGSFEYDGWTEIDARGYVNEKRIQVPADAYHRFAGFNLPKPCEHFFSTYTPDIHPQYVIVHSLLPCFQPSRYGPITYTTWFPPFKRSIYIEKFRSQQP